MPIDFAAIAGRFAAAAELQRHTVVLTSRLIHEVLPKRLLIARALELASREFPIVRFEDEALSVRVTAAQRAVLTGAPQLSLGHEIGAGALAFFKRGWDAASAPWRAGAAHAVIPDFIEAVNTTVASVEESVSRLATPKPQMFDRRSSTAVDLFGLAALAFRVIAEASGKGVHKQVGGGANLPPVRVDMPGGKLEEFAANVHAAQMLLPGGAAAEAVAQPDQQPPLVDALSADARNMLGGVLVLALLPTLLPELLDGLTVLVQDQLLGLALNIEAMALRLRVAAFDAVFGVVNTADRWSLLVAATQSVFSANVNFWFALGTEFVSGITTFIVLLGDYLQDWLFLLRGLPPLLSVLTHYNFVPQSPVPVTLSDLGSTALPQPAPLNFRSDFPDLSKTLFSQPTTDKITHLLDDTEHGARSELGFGLARAARRLDKLADVFASAETRAPFIAHADALGELPVKADTMANIVLGPELVDTTFSSGIKAVADQYESWLLTGGFETLSAVLDCYTGTLAQQWRAEFGTESELTAPISPTSPRLLLEHAVVGRVTMPRLTVRASGRHLNDELADAVATGFATAVQDSYRTARRQLRAMADAAGGG